MLQFTEESISKKTKMCLFMNLDMPITSKSL